MNDRFIQTQKLYQILDIEIFIFIMLVGFSTFLFYRFFLKDVSRERHFNIKTHLKSLFNFHVVLAVLFVLFSALKEFAASDATGERLLPYLGMLVFITGALCFVRSCRLFVLQYLFLGSMKAGVPLLLVNIFSLGLSVILTLWSVTHIFGVQLAPLLATSAAFSIVLGLALQDTLGNLFAGISLQLDKAFEIGDWLEVTNGTTKIVGQVDELSWRATVLTGFGDETIHLPNKLISQCQVSNFSPERRPILRGQNFKLPYNADIAKTCSLLEEAALKQTEVSKSNPPSAFILDTTEYGVTVRLIYYISDYGKQYGIGDRIISESLALLNKNGINLKLPQIQIEQTNTAN